MGPLYFLINVVKNLVASTGKTILLPYQFIHANTILLKISCRLMKSDLPQSNSGHYDGVPVW